MLIATDLMSAVDSFTGQATFQLPLVKLSGPNSLNLEIAAVYGGPAWKAASIWNIDAPTGVLGLGWSLPLPRIFLVTGQSAAPEAGNYFLLWRGSMRGLFCTGVSGDLWTFGTTGNDPWKISYNPPQQLWTLIDEDGTTHLFGDSLSGRNTVEYNVCWDNWTGASANVRGQRTLASGWLLNCSANRFGNSIAYSYDVVEVAVCAAQGQVFTQSWVLRKAVAADGSQAVFAYGAKQPAEYQNPHSNPLPPNAYQDPLNTQFLDHIDVIAASGTPLYTFQFLYAPTLLGPSGFGKRLLSGLQQVAPSGATLPAVQFSYWGQASGDGVSPAQPFDATTGALYGQIKSVTLMEGGTVGFTYAQTDELEYAGRSLQVDPPVTGAMEPRFYFEDKYVVGLWLDSANNCWITAYTWNGRWILQQLATLPVGSVSGYAAVQVATSPTSFTVWGGGRLYLFYTDPMNAGLWVAPDSSTSQPYYAPTFSGSEATLLAMGDGFAGLLGLSSGTLYRYRWLGLAWISDPAIALARGALTLAARDSVMVVVGASSAQSPATVWLYRRDVAGDWQSSQSTVDLGVVLPNQVSLEMGGTFAAYMGVQSVVGLQQAQYAVLWWSRDLETVHSSVWPIQTYASGVIPSPPIVANDVIAVGQIIYRFDGAQWNEFDFGAITYPNQSSADVSIGADVVVRRITVTGGGQTVFELSSYDPNTTEWNTTTSSQSSALLAIAAACSGDSISNYAVSFGQVQYCQPDGTWAAGQLLAGTFNASDLASVQVLGHDYVVYQTGTGTGAVQTALYLLQNGNTAATSPIILGNGQQIAIPGAGQNSLVGRKAFITYTGTFGTGNSVLTLYRPINLDAVAPQTGYVVATITADNGYASLSGYIGQLQNGWLYTTDGATVTEDGLTPLFNLTQSVPGGSGATAPSGTTSLYRFNGLVSTEIPALPYPSGSTTNAAGNISAVLGTPYAQTDMAVDGTTVVTSATFYQWVFASQVGSTGAGARVRTEQIVSSLDGVQSTTTRVFDPATGSMTSTSRSNVNELGQNQQFNQRFVYFSSIYDPSLALNILTPVVQETSETVNLSTSTTTTTAVSVQTFRDNWGYGPGQWAPDRAFMALSDSAPGFQSWNPGDPDPSGWLETTQTLQRAANGLPLDITDVFGRHTLTSYDNAALRPIVSTFNVLPGAANLSWYGCEPYEPFGAWSSNAPGKTIADYLTTTDFHTGTQCIGLPATPSGLAQGPMAVLVPTDQTRQYVFSSWARAANSFSPAQGLAQVTIAFFNPATGQPVSGVNDILVVLTPNSSASPITQWTYYPVLIDLPQLVLQSGLPALGLTVTLSNSNPTAVCFADELRFMPVDCRFRAAVYDPEVFLVTATVDVNGQARQVRYTEFLRPFLELGPLDRVNEVLDHAFSRGLTAADTFVPNLPNRTVRLASSLASDYYDFHDGNLADWNLADAANWQMTNGELVYSGADTDLVGATAQILLYQPSNFAVRVSVRQGAAAVSIAVGDGIYFMRWNADASQWELVEIVNGALTVLGASKVTSTPTGSWTFAVIDGFVLGYVNGVELFSYQYTPPTTIQPGYGKATLAATGLTAFDDLVLLNSPQIRVSFADGLGTQIQEVGLFGYSPTNNGGPLAGHSICEGLGGFYDAMNRTSAWREPLQANPVFQLQNNQGSQPAQLLNGAPASYLTDSYGNTLSLTQYLQGQGGYTYTSYTYETAPTSRLLTAVAPRAQDASAAAVTTSLAYYGSPTVTPPAPEQPVVGSLLYPVKALSRPFTQDSDGESVLLDTVTSYDQMGRVLVELQGPRSGTYLTTAFLYDAAGRTTQIRLPNYFAPPNGSSPGTWVISNTYSYLGLLQSRTTPDSGQLQMMYDSANRQRFVLDANGLASSPQRIRYIKYDDLDRLVETGYIQDANYSWGNVLQQKADVAAFPVISSSSGGNNAQGSWLKRLTYDVSGSGNVMYLLGRLYQAQVNQNVSPTPPDTETYGYDAYGNVSSKAVSMGVLGQTATTGFTYNNQDQPLQVVYPALDTNNPTIGLSYDRLGRLAAVGFPDPQDGVVDPWNPPPAPSQRFAVYSYDVNGRLATATLNTAQSVPAFTRSFAYNANGWLTTVADPYFTESLGYGQGADGLTYLNGLTTSTAIQYSPSSVWSSAPLPYTVQFSYDGYERITAAQASGPGSQDGWSLQVPANGYDANGNLQTLAQGQTSLAYAYRSGGSPSVPVSNQVSTLTSSVANNVDFDLIPPNQKSAYGWSWQSNNGGPSGSQTTTTQHPPGLAQSLELTGGGLGHYEVLVLDTYLPPTASLTLACQVLTAPGYGEATWFAILYRAEGPSVAVPIWSIQTGASWQTLSVPINLATLTSTYGGGNVVGVGIELRNQSRSADGSTGASIFVAALSLTGTVVSPAYQYDSNGNTTQALARSLYSLSYNPVTGRTSGMQFGSSSGNLLELSYGLDDIRTLKTYQTSGSTPAILGATLTVTGLAGEPIAEQISIGSAVTVRYYIPGVSGVVAVMESGQIQFLLDDHLGSQRLLVDSVTGNVENALDYVSFGSLIRANNYPQVSRTFTGQELDEESGLYDYHARLYDSAIGRFYSPDPLGQFASPYTYVGNDPVNATDPSGAWALRPGYLAATAGVAALAVGSPLLFAGYLHYWRGYGRVMDPPREYFDTAELQKLRKDLSIEARRPHAGATWTDDVLRGKSYDWRAYARFELAHPRNTTQCDFAAPRWQNGTVLADGEYMYTLDKNHHFNVLDEFFVPDPSGNGAGTWEQYRSHAQLGGGLPVYAAGRLRVRNGIITEIDNSSGHYRPSALSLDYALYVLANLYGLDITRSSVVPHIVEGRKLDPTFAPPQPDSLKIARGIYEHLLTDYDKIGKIMWNLWRVPQDAPYNKEYFLFMRHNPGERPDVHGKW